MSQTPNTPTPTPTPNTSPTPDAPKAAKKVAELSPTQAAGIKLESRVLLEAVHGRMIHPFQNEALFEPGKATKVTFDRWCEIQFDAGKLKLAKDD